VLPSRNLRSERSPRGLRPCEWHHQRCGRAGESAVLQLEGKPTDSAPLFPQEALGVYLNFIPPTVAWNIAPPFTIVKIAIPL